MSTAKLLNYPDVCERVGLARVSIARLVAKGAFPQPVPLMGTRVGFVESEVDEWIAQRIAARSTPAMQRQRKARSKAMTELVSGRWAA